ncbi:MAG: DHH family phosphoesterase [Erysipelotrichaceae bacterium]|nr:DHH family phosphoesterase [Erysipelotrichaceae bacterium]
MKERICQLNGIDPTELEISAFLNMQEIPEVVAFKETILDNREKRYLIVGDYDCDGICATVIIKRLLDRLNILNNYIIPSRSRQGYGLNEEIVNNAHEYHFDIILCVDNGVTAYEPIKLAKEHGIQVFVIDHHEYSELPDFEALLHPNLLPEAYHDMCAAGLCALLSDHFDYDELSAVYGGLATIADMVPVLRYNRYLIKRMYDILKTEDILPIRYLLNDAELDYESLSYTVIPKINAISRLEELMNVNHMVRYLLENDPSCRQYLGYIEKINRIRKEDTRLMYDSVKASIRDEDSFLLIRSDTFKEGLCGLLANRLMNEYHKPVVILSEKEGELKGSGRSPAGFDLYTYLKVFSELFHTFGGHEQAVGLSLSTDDYERLKEDIRNNPCVIPEKMQDVLLIDSDKIDPGLLSQLEALQPYGTSFKEPLFAMRNVSYASRFLVARKYPKFVISRQLEAISFDPSDANKPFDTMIGRIKRDRYHKNRISFVIEELLQFYYNLDISKEVTL